MDEKENDLEFPHDGKEGFIGGFWIGAVKIFLKLLLAWVVASIIILCRKEIGALLANDNFRIAKIFLASMGAGLILWLKIRSDEKKERIAVIMGNKDLEDMGINNPLPKE